MKKIEIYVKTKSLPNAVYRGDVLLEKVPSIGDLIKLPAKICREGWLLQVEYVRETADERVKVSGVYRRARYGQNRRILEAS